MIAGHAYYFLSEVYPRMTNRRPLKTPGFLKALFADEPVVVARPENVRFAAAPFDEIHQDWSLHFQNRNTDFVWSDIKWYAVEKDNSTKPIDYDTLVVK